jgi:hypothetical protein
MDHDQRFKSLIREFFADFLRLFFDVWAARLDLTAIEWLDKEVFPDPPEGTRHSLDLVARVPVAKTEATPSLTILLIHVEIESPDRTTELKPRLPYYYHFLRDKYQLPVLPIVIYLKVSLDGIGTDVVSERVWDLEVSRFQYLYVGLPGLDAIEYVQGDNWLGVALSALMRIPQERIVSLGAEALRRVAGAPLSEQQRFLLHECVESYLPLEAGQRQELERQLHMETYAEVQTMNQTTYEKGIEKGRREERLGLLVSLLETRFGPLSAATREHLEQASMEELRRLALQFATAASLDELGLPH